MTIGGIIENRTTENKITKEARMPKHEFTYTVERNGKWLVDGWRLRQYQDGVRVKTGVFTPNGGWDTADDIARDIAEETGWQWVEDNTPKAEIPW